VGNQEGEEPTGSLNQGFELGSARSKPHHVRLRPLCIGLGSWPDSDCGLEHRKQGMSVTQQTR